MFNHLEGWKCNNKAVCSLKVLWICPALAMKNSILQYSRSNPHRDEAKVQQQRGAHVETVTTVLFKLPLCIYPVATIQTRSDVFHPWCALLSQDTDVWADASGLRSVMRTPSYAWWHPVREPASEGQTDKLFSLKFCINVAQMAAHDRD